MKRGKLDICLDVLKAIEYGSLKITHITHKANLNITELKKLLSVFIRQGYVEIIAPIGKHGSKPMKICHQPQYRITVKGKEFLRQVRLVKELQQAII